MNLVVQFLTFRVKTGTDAVVIVFPTSSLNYFYSHKFFEGFSAPRREKLLRHDELEMKTNIDVV